MNVSRCPSARHPARSCSARDHDAFDRGLIAIGETADLALARATSALARSLEIVSIVMEAAKELDPAKAAELGLTVPADPAPAPAPAPALPDFSRAERGGLRVLKGGAA